MANSREAKALSMTRIYLVRLTKRVLCLLELGSSSLDCQHRFSSKVQLQENNWYNHGIG